MHDFCIVNLHDLRIFTFCNPAETSAQIARAEAFNRQDIARVSALIDAPCNADGYFSKYLNEYKQKCGQYVGMTFDEFKQREREKLLSQPLEEINAERFEEMRDILPPIKWTRRDGVEMFCMSEMYTGTYTSQYAHDHHSGKFYTKLVDLMDESTWIHNLL